MTFIHTIPPEQADGEVREMYRRQEAHFGYLPNYARAFSHRPEVMASWAALLASIRRHVAPRRFELVTLAAASALGNSYCALAHGKALGQWLDDEIVAAIAGGREPCGLDAAERELLVFARKVSRDASRVTADDVARLREGGLADDEIFDIVTVVAGRAFFTKVLDGLGVEADAAYRELPGALIEALTMGRPIARSASASGQDPGPGGLVSSR
ncbi:carboxymuconolactone decarboxylase family protein [Halomonas sp. HK25]|uniref:carboxymuconolactone decarboxylase family protein n=1 Tax=Halomonas sp. HK25 TaxID=3394321 RepID=UPI0039FC9604